METQLFEILLVVRQRVNGGAEGLVRNQLLGTVNVQLYGSFLWAQYVVDGYHQMDESIAVCFVLRFFGVIFVVLFC